MAEFLPPPISRPAPPAISLEAPVADMTYRAKGQMGLSITTPGYTGGITVGVQTSLSWKDNGVFIEVSGGLGGVVNASAGKWSSSLITLSLTPEVSIGGEWGRPQRTLLSQSELSKANISFFSFSPPNADGSYSWSLSDSHGLTFGATNEEVLTLLVSPGTVIDYFGGIYRDLERMHLEAMSAIGYPGSSMDDEDE
ncbi:hypothetical protein [Caballeronia sp. GACF5]|uniref:hypothetical protein n=1 Tax=Caballeronia sp. GACF5 TaxID=2921746 RepID=UPI002027A94D|nr:hypothetical protein [Caballeronia sp. GACF5]